jgi:hypothetical protein
VYDSLHFYLSQALDKVPHTLLLDKLHSLGQSSLCFKWFKSCLSTRSSFVHILGKSSSPYSVLCGVPQGSKLGPLVFSVFISDLCTKMNYSKFILFADDLKIYRDIKSVEDCKYLQTDIDSVQQWCGENHMELNIQKNKIKFFTGKTNIIHCNYYFSGFNFAY